MRKERIIDLRQFFLYLWKKAVIILLVSFLGCVLFVGYSYFKQKKAIEAENKTIGSKNASIEDIMQQNFNKSYGLDDVDFNTETEPPVGSYNSTIRLYVDFDFNSLVDETSLDASSILGNVQGDANNIVTAPGTLQNIIEDLNLTKYKDMKKISPNELRWMIVRYFLGANTMQITVTDVDKERAEEIVVAVTEEFIENSKEYIPVETVKIIDGPITISAEEKVETTTQKHISKKKLLKYAIVGGAGMFILISAIYLMIFIFVDVVRNEFDFEYLDMKMLGIIRKKKYGEEDIKRFAYSMISSGERKVFGIVPADKESYNEELVETFSKAAESLGKSVTVVKLEDVAVDKIKETINKAKDKKDLLLLSTKDINSSFETVVAASCCDTVVINTTFAKTRMKDLEFTKNEIVNSGSIISGAIISEVC